MEGIRVKMEFFASDKRSEMMGKWGFKQSFSWKTTSSLGLIVKQQ
jgi:hypothetical protein